MNAKDPGGLPPMAQAAMLAVLYTIAALIVLICVAGIVGLL
jgi:hypothetical protein